MRICELKQKKLLMYAPAKALAAPLMWNLTVNKSADCADCPGAGRFCSFFGRESEYIIPWECICQIGEDIILVKIQEDKCLHKEREHLL